MNALPTPSAWRTEQRLPDGSWIGYIYTSTAQRGDEWVPMYTQSQLMQALHHGDPKPITDVLLSLEAHGLYHDADCVRALYRECEMMKMELPSNTKLLCATQGRAAPQ
jgi:hypothetical protein